MCFESPVIKLGDCEQVGCGLFEMGWGFIGGSRKGRELLIELIINGSDFKREESWLKMTRLAKAFQENEDVLVLPLKIFKN